jgi:hypothetical protein
MNPYIQSIVISPQAGKGAKPLVQGQSVRVRVLESLGAGKYIVSFGGARFTAVSGRPLNTGDFFATIRVQDGKIMLVPGRSAEENSGVIHFLPDAASGEITPSIASFLSSLSIPADSLSYTIVRFLQQFGFKFDASLAQKARRLAAKFPGHESHAAEAALFLLEKGIDADSSTIEAVLELCGNHDGSNPNPNAQDNAQTHDEDAPEEDVQTEDSPLLNLYDADSLLRASPGMLTFCNHRVSSDRHWVLLPFTAGKSAHGIIRFLLNLPQKSTEKTEIRVQVLEIIWYFVIYYKARIPYEIVFFCDAKDGLPNAEQAVSELLEVFSPFVRVRFSSDAMSAGMFLDNKELRAFQAEV